MSKLAATPEATAPANAANQDKLMLKVAPGPTAPALYQQALPTAEQPAQANLAESAPAVNPLRVIEIALLALVVVLGIITLAARRKQA
jgi:hypothetical protein